MTPIRSRLYAVVISPGTFIQRPMNDEKPFIDYATC
jgi:hypothetical protein